MSNPVVAPPSRNSVDLERWTARMTVLGRVIVVSAVVATVAALALVERLGRTYEDGLAVTERSAELVADAVEPVRVLGADLASLVVTVSDGLDGAQALLATSQVILDDIGVASATNLADITGAAADVADRLARQLELIERLIPGDTQSVAEELRSLADGLEPVADQLRDLGGQLQTAAGQLGGTTTAVADLAARVDAIATDIAEIGPTLDALGATAVDLRDRAGSASDRVDLDIWLLRLLVVVGGVGFAVIGLITQRLAAMLAIAVATGATSPPSS